MTLPSKITDGVRNDCDREITQGRPMNIEKICRDLFDCGDRVHKALGGGFTEAVNQNALTIEFREMGLPYLKEVNIEIFYRGHSIGTDRPDFVLLPTKKKGWRLDEPLVLETKVAAKLTDDHRQQLKTYLKSLPRNKNTDISSATKGVLLRFSKSETYSDEEDAGQPPKQPEVEVEFWSYSARSDKMKRRYRLPTVE